MALKWNGGGFDRPQPQEEVKMANYLVLKSCVAGGMARNAGDVVELSDQEGKSLSNMGRVQISEDRVVPVVADRSVGLQVSNAPKISKRAKKD